MPELKKQQKKKKKKSSLEFFHNKSAIDTSLNKTKPLQTNSGILQINKNKINKKLKKGKVPINKKIDFHGMSVLDAKELFIGTIQECYTKNLRCLLFVTGKGIFKKKNQEQTGTKLYYGKIRESFFEWIKTTEVSNYILNVEQAGIEYGADGAFFVYLRKLKN